MSKLGFSTILKSPGNTGIKISLNVPGHIFRDFLALFRLSFPFETYVDVFCPKLTPKKPRMPMASEEKLIIYYENLLSSLKHMYMFFAKNQSQESQECQWLTSNDRKNSQVQFHVCNICACFWPKTTTKKAMNANGRSNDGQNI